YAVFPFFSESLLANGGEKAEAAAEEAFSLLYGLRFAYGLTPGGCASECAVRLLAEGRAPFAIVGEWRLAELRAALGARLGLAALPPLPKTGAKVGSVKRELGLVVAADAQGGDKQTAEELVSYLKSDCRARLLAVLGKLPVQAQAPA